MPGIAFVAAIASPFYLRAAADAAASAAAVVDCDDKLRIRWRFLVRMQITGVVAVATRKLSITPPSERNLTN